MVRRTLQKAEIKVEPFVCPTCETTKVQAHVTLYGGNGTVKITTLHDQAVARPEPLKNLPYQALSSAHLVARAALSAGPIDDEESAERLAESILVSVAPYWDSLMLTVLQPFQEANVLEPAAADLVADVMQVVPGESIDPMWLNTTTWTVWGHVDGDRVIVIEAQPDEESAAKFKEFSPVNQARWKSRAAQVAMLRDEWVPV